MKTIEKKEPYLHILNTRGNIYEEFLPDQVLTHKNLNKIVNYFEDQDRLSRIYLSGVGIGCGLNIVSSSNQHIEIGQGVGITTDGDIIKSETRRFQYYSALTDKADYATFQNGEMEVYEIYEQEATGRPGDELPLASFSINESTTLKDCIVIAYVENYTEDEGLCGGSGCDETGNKVYSNLKFLITHKSNYSKLIEADTIYQNHDVLSYYDTLPELCLPRVILTKNNTDSGIAIHDQYKAAFFLKDDLYIGIATIIGQFSSRINFAKYGIFTNQIAGYIDTIFGLSDDEYIQYRYDLLKDLIDTYREIRDLILHSKFECVPNIKAFPKHLLLGTPETSTRLQTRHQFYPSPIVSENDENLIAIKTLCIKFYNQLVEFKIPDYNSAQIKITPSKGYDAKLSERTIPYYYRTYKSLVTNWNPVSNSNRKETNQLGYHIGNLKKLPCIEKPLEYNHLDKDFYRIEGHQGKNFVTALKGILTLKAKYNLPFDVKAISIGYPVNKISLDDDTCETKEYTTLIQTWEKEFCCTADKAVAFFKQYQYVDPGVNDTVADVYTVDNALQAEKDKEVAEGVKKEEAVKTEEAVKLDIRNALNIKAAKEDVSKEELAQKDQKLRIGRSVLTNVRTKGDSRDTVAFVVEQVIANINPENLTSDYVVSQAVNAIQRQGSNIDVDGDEFKLYVEVPLRMITNLQIVKYRFIKKLNDVYVTERWSAFHNAFSDLCTEVQKVIFTVSETTEKGKFGTRVHDKMYEYLINQIANLCCIKERFNWLKLQLDDIRKNLYKELILSKLIEKHPGIEHMAGVPKGGTFLMVYIGEKKVTMDDSRATIETFDRKVLYDFALPYMCMAECAPATIVYSDIVDPVTLAISKKKYCLPSDEGQVDFIIEPENGVVTSPDGSAFIITTATGYAFDPTNVPDALLGEGIRFLVDGKIPTIPIETIVYKLPQAVTATYEFVTWTDDGLVINLNVTHELEEFLYLQHIWKRENGSEMAVGTNPTNILIITDATQFQEDITLVIDVIGNPVPCKLEIPVTIDEEREIIEVGVEVASEVCFNTQITSPDPVPINVTPDNGVLTSPQAPIDAQNFIELFDGNYSLNPLFVSDALAGEPITYRVDGIPVVDVQTRVYKLPGFVDTAASGVISWDDTGVNIRLTATHAYDNKAYLEYEWLNENNEVIGNALTTNFRIDTVDTAINRTFSLRMRVIGIEDDLCSASGFSVNIEDSRPQIIVNIPTAICWLENVPQALIAISVSDDTTELTCPQQEAFGVQILSGIPGNYTINREDVPDELIGVPIIFEVNGAPAAVTTVYKLPSSVGANYNNATWSGDTLTIDITGSHNLEGQIDTIEDYLSYVWKDESGNTIFTTKEFINYSINGDGGTFSEEYTLQIKVKDELIENACETETVPVVIDETRPVIEVLIAPEICHIETENSINESIPISVTPPSYELTSPDGAGFIGGSIGNYTLRPALIPEELLGQSIRFVVDGQVQATTKVYKIPELVRRSINLGSETWVPDGLAIQLTSTIISRSYYNYQWFMRVNGVNTELNKINEPNIYLIPDSGDGVNVEVFLRISSSGTNILCTQETIRTRVVRNRSITVSKDKFCLPDTPVAFRGVSPETGNLESTSRLLPLDVITVNSDKYVFNPNNVPESFWGTTLRFSVDGITQSGVAINVYKMPAKESIIQDIPASRWASNGYEFTFTHELIDKSYFQYDLVLISNRARLQKIRNHTYLISTFERSIDDQIEISISINDVPCNVTALIDVRALQTDNPSERLNCTTPYAERLNILKIPESINSLKDLYNKQEFESTILRDVLNPLEQLINGIINARNINSIAEAVALEINSLRVTLETNFNNNPNIDTGFYVTFLALDEIMEVIMLETLRCIDTTSSILIDATNRFFTDSNTKNGDYSKNPRNIIDNTYVTNYKPRISNFKTKGDSIFTVAKRR